MFSIRILIVYRYFRTDILNIKLKLLIKGVYGLVNGEYQFEPVPLACQANVANELIPKRS
jgi:hypothetical protein